ncbi:Kynurenine formamidase [Orchesella cincta]|uniref:Kynurenine formamidase n=1 Tax=Orchesella cincta TaxID=48709 RepID=A0A1D2M0F5_ORCCI|nr:Kynurenine formamidase [Orchesella cincta]
MGLFPETTVHVQTAFSVNFLLLLQVFLGSFSSAYPIDRPEYIDLSYVNDDSTIFYPGQRFDYDLMQDVSGFNHTMQEFPYWFHSNYYYRLAMFSFCMGEHGGTHVDAPYHFNPLGWKLSEIPVERLTDVPAAVIDVERHVFALSRPDKYALEVSHILEHEAKHGPIPMGGIVLVRTGWSRFLARQAEIFRNKV